jgi:hypothetical protein
VQLSGIAWLLSGPEGDTGSVPASAPVAVRPQITTLAKPSIAGSRPKLISAMEPAAMPATIATAPPTVIHKSDSIFTRRATPLAAGSAEVDLRGDRARAVQGVGVVLIASSALTLLITLFGSNPRE